MACRLPDLGGWPLCCRALCLCLRERCSGAGCCAPPAMDGVMQGARATRPALLRGCIKREASAAWLAWSPAKGQPGAAAMSLASRSQGVYLPTRVTAYQGHSLRLLRKGGSLALGTSWVRTPTHACALLVHASMWHGHNPHTGLPRMQLRTRACVLGSSAFAGRVWTSNRRGQFLPVTNSRRLTGSYEMPACAWSEGQARGRGNSGRGQEVRCPAAASHCRARVLLRPSQWGPGSDRALSGVSRPPPSGAHATLAAAARPSPSSAPRSRPYMGTPRPQPSLTGHAPALSSPQAPGGRALTVEHVQLAPVGRQVPRREPRAQALHSSKRARGGRGVQVAKPVAAPPAADPGRGMR